MLNTLNFYWFGKMIETVKKRFQPSKEKSAAATVAMDGARPVAEERLKMEIDANGHKSVLAEETRIRRRKG